MPAALNPLAITEVEYTLCLKVEIEKSLTEDEPLLNIDDEIEEGDARDPKFDISLEGKGDLPDGLLAGEEELAVVGVTGGKTIVLNTDETEHHDTRNEWAVSAKNWPAAA
ncbi:hypothetical protein [Verrucomicrobium spinosum]|uniref:hypothetical protein n=1 Tax=Verrucomicrobium spinosum TaxID=2736 RepID=UPI000174666B|nr:hypothetical protein [Verrucomicrobium spinosum]